jgi:hypothetical protein
MNQTRAVYGTPNQMTAWIVLNIVPGHSIIPAILATILLSGKVRRHPAFISFLCVWVVAAISSSILVYVGKTSGPEPPTGVCLFQASLLYGYPPMTSLAAFTIVLQVSPADFSCTPTSNAFYRHSSPFEQPSKEGQQKIDQHQSHGSGIGH